MGLFNKTSDYQKACENKIKELCGGFTPSDYFTEKAYSYKYEKNPSNNNEKAILKDGCSEVWFLPCKVQPDKLEIVHG